MLMDLIKNRHSIRKYTSEQISRGEETFSSEKGKKLVKEWGVPDNYTCQAFVILGYIDGEEPQSKPRKPGRIQIVE